MGLQERGRAHLLETFFFRRRTSSCTAPCAECSGKSADDNVDSPDVFACICVCVCGGGGGQGVTSGRIHVNTHSDASLF